MPGQGRGRRTTTGGAGRLEKKLEEDELFKEIGGQLDANKFDYSEWQRTSSGKGLKTRPSQTTADSNGFSKTQEMASSSGGPSQEKAPFTISSGPAWASQKHGVGPSVSRTCHHGAQRRNKKDPARDEAAAKKKAEQIKILQLRIRARRKTIEEYTKRHAELLEQNMKLKDTIEKDEKVSHDEVKKLLRTYEKFRGGISTLNDQFIQEMANLKKDLDRTRLRIEIDIAALQKNVDSMDDLLAAAQSELHVLVNYKDKEYPVKSLTIAELQKEIEQLEVQHKEDENDLCHVVESEVDKFRKRQNRVQQDMTKKVTDQTLALMHPSLKDMALQNMVMKKEKDYHVKEIEQLEGQNKELKQEVARLLKDPKTSLRQQMFPEFFPTREKCTPDMEVVLDIPTQEWLPI